MSEQFADAIYWLNERVPRILETQSGLLFKLTAPKLFNK